MAINRDDTIINDKLLTKPGEVRQTVKSVLTTSQSCYSTQSSCISIIGAGKLHHSLNSYHDLNYSSKGEKTHNCVLCLINMLFSDENAPKFEEVGGCKDKDVLNADVASNDDQFWQ